MVLTLPNAEATLLVEFLIVVVTPPNHKIIFVTVS